MNQEFSNEKQKIIQFEESKITINKIGKLIEQKEQCNAVVFNKQGSIMVSTFDKQIKIWEFDQGVLKLALILSGHQDSVQCLYFSKLSNYFISTSKQTIKFWILADKWICQQTINMNQASITCIIADQKEKSIIFGCTDNSIQICHINDQNDLKKICDLNKHDQQVNTLCLNQSETILVSCADESAKDKEQIIVWEKTQNQQNPFKFKYFVRQNSKISGPQIKFIIQHMQLNLYKEERNIMIILFQTTQFYQQNLYDIDKNKRTKLKFFQLVQIFGNDQKNYQLQQFKKIIQKKKDQFFCKINKAQLFEDCLGELLQNFNRGVDLFTIGDCECLFPILYNIQRKLLYFKIKSCIYILDNNLQLQSFLQSNGMNIQGSFTNDGQYLVYWDGKNKGYSISEICNH